MHVVNIRPFASATGAVVGLLLAVWAAVVVWAAESGWLRTVAMPYFALFIAIGIAVPTLAYFGVRPFQRWVQSQGLLALSLIHVWRIPAALLFFHVGLAGALPPTFWLLAGVGDLLAGALAATLRRHSDTAAFRRFHRFGLTDFVMAVGTGLAFTLLGDTRMETLATLPMALIPLFGVGISGATHLIAFDLMRRQAAGRPTTRESGPCAT